MLGRGFLLSCVRALFFLGFLSFIDTYFLCDEGREYARADFRWGIADETVVSLELLTVFGAGPLCCYILYQLVHGDLRRHYWIVVLCTAEIYGGWV